jgi:hypothetical protein
MKSPFLEAAVGANLSEETKRSKKRARITGLIILPIKFK